MGLIRPAKGLLSKLAADGSTVVFACDVDAASRLPGASGCETCCGPVGHCQPSADLKANSGAQRPGARLRQLKQVRRRGDNHACARTKPSTLAPLRVRCSKENQRLFNNRHTSSEDLVEVVHLFFAAGDMSTSSCPQITTRVPPIRQLPSTSPHSHAFQRQLIAGTS